MVHQNLLYFVFLEVQMRQSLKADYGQFETHVQHDYALASYNVYVEVFKVNGCYPYLKKRRKKAKSCRECLKYFNIAFHCPLMAL